MKYLVEAQILLRETIEADSKEQAEQKMQDIISDTDITELDFMVEAYEN